MLPNISPNGQSFIGAGAYHLHDKHTLSAQRVLFTATRNLINDDAHAALREMTHTAFDAPHAKAFNSQSQAGRKNTTPVKTISLAWAPHERPSQTQMIAAADNFLLSMGWQQHQAVFAAHGDTAHPHLHIILNRVHAATGKTLSDWQDKKRAQAWALSYEQRHGAILCHGRINHMPAASLPPGISKALSLHTQRTRLSRNIRRQFRKPWRQYFQHQRMLQHRFSRQARQLRAAAFSFSREGAHSRAASHLHTLGKRHAALQNHLRTQRATIRKARALYVQQLLARYPAPDFRGVRQRLLATQRANYAALRAAHGPNPAQLAQSEIAQLFAHRWAEIRKGPAALRAAAASALAAEQHAALDARSRQLAANQALGKRHELSRLTTRHRAERRAITYRQLTRPVQPPRPARS